MLRRVLPVLYLVIGLVVAAQYSYLTNLSSVVRVLSAVLAVALWPLVLLGINLTIK